MGYLHELNKTNLSFLITESFTELEPTRHAQEKNTDNNNFHKK